MTCSLSKAAAPATFGISVRPAEATMAAAPKRGRRDPGICRPPTPRRRFMLRSPPQEFRSSNNYLPKSQIVQATWDDPCETDPRTASKL
jgi:hypothetical protein